MKHLLLIVLVIVSFVQVHAGGWIQKADFGGEARHRTTSITIGNKFYTGLGHYNGAGPNILFGDWWEYDPATNAWTQKADYLGGPCYHATGFVLNNIGYVGTGRISASGSTLVQDFYQYDAATNSWTQTTSFPSIGRRGAVSFVIDGFAYVGTGESNSGRTADFFKFDPTTQSWSPIATLPGQSRTSSVAFSIGSFGYVGTGDVSGGSQNDFWQYDPSTDTWTQKPDVGPTDRREAMGFSLNGRGYLGTGVDFSSGNNFKDMWEYDPTTETWTQIDEFPGTARRYFSATVLNGVAYCSMGTNGTNFKDLWLFDQTLSLLENNPNLIEWKLYPNPASDFVNIDYSSDLNIDQKELEVAIYTSTGTLVLNQKLDQKVIDISNLSAATYHIKLKYREKLINSITLLKQ